MDRIGRYRITRELGRGAMGVVYHAIDPNIGRPVAIKTIRFGEVSNEDERARLKERLFREARSAGRLSHPGIVTVYDVDEDGDLAYIAMEFVNGPTLDQLMSGQAPLEPERLFAILAQAAVALDYAHGKGIVHRDIKPANIMLDEDGQAKITDFGIAKFTANEQFTLTGAIVGTPHYMSPEQVQGLAVDGRSDQFSLCVVAFEILTGERPFVGEHLTTVVYKIVAEQPVSPQRLNPSLGPKIESVLRRALAKKPDARYSSCQEMVDALEDACNGTPGWRPMIRGGVLNAPTFIGSTRGPGEMRGVPPRRARDDDSGSDGERRRVSFVPLLLAILVAAGLVGLIAWQAAPWLTRTAIPPQQQAQTSPPPKPAAPGPPAPAAEEPKKPGPMPAGEKPPAAQPQGADQPKPEEPKAVESKPEETETEKPAEEPPFSPRRAAVKPVPARTYPIFVPSSPAGATAVLDGRAETECTTPCSIPAPPGRHTVTITLPGRITERREVVVGNSAQELPLITLSAPGGTLMLSTTPPGAGIWINGRSYPQKTPAQINLPSGRYTVTVEKDGRRASESVEIRNGINMIRIPLGQ